MAELHLIGEITGATGYREDNLFCSFHVEKGSHWTHVSGLEKGQTQVNKRHGEDMVNIFAHPIDIHYSTPTVVGWPKIVIQVWYNDNYGRNDFVAYGVLNIPSQGGYFELECPTWRPVGNLKDRIGDLVVGGRMQVKDLSIVHNGEDRRKLTTISCGTVYIKLNVLLRNFKKYGVSTTQVQQ
ncbi:hypothetical protein NAEGRDRAFT_30379 [Naegleria gruberi]|uniref:B9 domain-containing protein 2 n=1 Tax=Naegleria gruberi TaxID=5762 RepID=D2V2P0_NAEGR|nr:uncharacterized protein NAEGRDRAFT_30379 [Naegleria gruberi]EFC48927.1 hypothetical protein NAEGRDRAFT_30379 [Naegleria gruberi]|eukprot:XP_002681671.1 hypothetical protein NAEGRDRAFT_30379 [Naegleria gruberi strain NEG-M]